MCPYHCPYRCLRWTNASGAPLVVARTRQVSASLLQSRLLHAFPAHLQLLHHLVPGPRRLRQLDRVRRDALAVLGRQALQALQRRHRPLADQGVGGVT